MYFYLFFLKLPCSPKTIIDNSKNVVRAGCTLLTLRISVDENKKFSYNSVFMYDKYGLFLF